MQPFYEDPWIRLFHGDCREHPELWNIPDGVLVTDPPYGMAYVSNSSKYGPTDPIAGDGDPTLRDDILNLWGADRPALVFGTWRVPRPEHTRTLLVWDKGDSPGMGDLTLPWGPGHEEIYVIGSGFKGRRRTNVIRRATLSAGDPERMGHPTPKPVALLRDLIAYCPPELTVVDPFAGSGTTLRAAKDLGRKAIGFEIEERYCEMIVDRLAQEVLFALPVDQPDDEVVEPLFAGES